MKKKIKKKGLFDHKFNFILDEKLNNIKLEDQAPKKLEEANRSLSRMKSFPK